ncbi:MAG: metal ABC transporter substrate-binding protein [Nocardioidaceae bacterium]
MTRGIAALVAMVALAPLLAACNDPSAQSGPHPHVIAAFYPYAFVAQEVAGSHGTITNLTRIGVEPHDLELTPQEVADISAADLVIYEKSFQPAVDSAVTQNPPKETLDVTSVVPLRDTGSPGKSGIGTIVDDPHIWLDPLLLIPVTDKVAVDLAKADPKHSADYRRNAAALIVKLKGLNADYKRGLAHCQRRLIVTSHAAFGYMAEQYGLTMVPIAGLSPDVEPSPQHIAALQNLIQQDHITTVFSEVLGSAKYAQTLAQDLGIKAAVLDPIEGLTSADSSQNYLSLMHLNLVALQKANGCT